MQSRRDHVQAYEFASGRLASALVTGDAGLGQQPLRRSSLGVLFGILAALLLVGGFAVYGLINPGGNTAWRTQGSIIVEEETGNRYLYVGGELHPTMNLASAMLVEGSSAQVRSVSRNSLAGVPHGAPIGIPGAPDSLPARGSLLPGTWSMCLHPGIGDGMTLDLDPGSRIAGTPGRSRALVSGVDGTKYVIFANTKFRLATPAVVLALGLGDQIAQAAPPQWLAALPSGPNVGPAAVDGSGSDAPAMDAHVGDLFQTNSAGVDQFYVMRGDGLAPMTRTEAVLMSVLPGAQAPKRMSPADIASAPASKDDSLLHRLPDLVGGTALHPDGSALCVRQRVTRTDPNHPLTDVVLERGAATGPERVLVPTGRGVLAVATPLPAHVGEQPIRFLITDLGVKYRIFDDSANSALGYGGVPLQPVPRSVLSLLPDGPLLVSAKGVQ